MNYNDHFPIDLGDRPLRFESKQTNPAQLVREQLHRIFQNQRAESDALLACLAQTCFQVKRVKDELADDESSSALALETIGDILGDLLTQHQVTINDCTGEKWSTERLDEIECRGHRTCEGITEPTIAHMELPVVHRQGTLIAKGAASVDAPIRD